MGRILIDDTHEDIHFAICDRIEHAERNHPEGLTPLERLESILDELCEVEAELLRGNFARAMDEYRDVGAPLYRAMKELHRKHGVPFR